MKRIERVSALVGLFLFITNLNHASSRCELIEFSWNPVSKFNLNLKLIEEKHSERSRDGTYASISPNITYDHSKPKKEYSVLSARFIRSAKYYD